MAEAVATVVAGGVGGVEGMTEAVGEEGVGVAVVEAGMVTGKFVCPFFFFFDVKHSSTTTVGSPHFMPCMPLFFVNGLMCMVMMKPHRFSLLLRAGGG